MSNPYGIHFQEGFITTVATEALIEDYQMLSKAYNSGDWSLVQCTMECIANVIANNTVAPKEGLKITPSPSSVINLAINNGILMDGENDVQCKAGHPVSNAIDCCGDTTCSKECPYFGKECLPESGPILLQNDVPYYMDAIEDEYLDIQLQL